MGFPISYKKGSDAWVGKAFRAKEFDCPCPDCTETKIDSDLIKQLDRLREILASPITITSGYRCDRYQAELARRGYETAKGISTHQMGQAADLKTGKHTGEEIAKAASKAGFKAIGVGKMFCHLDMRSDKDRRWLYSY